MNGCHSTLSPSRLQHSHVAHSQNESVKWPYSFTTECQYSKDIVDLNCAGCKQNMKGEK